MKYFFSQVVILLVIVVCIPVAGSAEYIFKKDGSIIKGSIVKDEIATLTVKKEDGAYEGVVRGDILRIIYTEVYLGKVFARLTSGEVVEGYQVDEDRDNYFFRKDLISPEEFTVPRKKVMFIARTNPTDLKGNASTVSIEVTWSPPFKPAKFYRIYLRDVKNKDEKFKLAEETSDLSTTLKNLQKSWTYEIYATAIADTGEESLPSEKVIVNTLPEPPGNFNIAEKLSADGKSVTLAFSWTDVGDPLSRVKSYAIYETENGERKKKGTSPGSEFIIKNFPAEGRHRFSVVAVNDIFTESKEMKAVYDAGYKIYIRGAVSYIYPLGVMSEMASYGYGGLIDAGASGKSFSLGIETGYWIFSYTGEIDNMVMVPVLFDIEYTMLLFYKFSLRPVLKSGGSYNVIKYLVRNPSDPLITSTTDKSSFNPMVSAGAYLQFELTEKVDIYGGADYSAIFQKSGRMSFVNGSLGACIIF